MAVSPTKRTLDALKAQGAYCDMAERFLMYGGGLKFSTIGGKRVGRRTGVRKDLFGIIDIIALFPDREGIWGIQSCGTAFSEHKKKILSNFFTQKWLEKGGLELWGWRPLKEGKRKVWRPRVHQFSLLDF